MNGRLGERLAHLPTKAADRQRDRLAPSTSRRDDALGDKLILHGIVSRFVPAQGFAKPAISRRAAELGQRRNEPVFFGPNRPFHLPRLFIARIRSDHPTASPQFRIECESRKARNPPTTTRTSSNARPHGGWSLGRVCQTLSTAGGYAVVGPRGPRDCIGQFLRDARGEV